MSSKKKTKEPGKQLKTINRLKKVTTTVEVIVGVLFIIAAVVLFVPGVKTELIKGMAGTTVGQKIISWFGSKAYADSVFD